MSVDGATLGAVICVAFSGVWGVIGASGLPRQWRMWVLGSSIVVSVATIVWRLLPHVSPGSGVFRGDVYFEAVAFEAVGIVVAVWLLRRLGHREYILPVVGFIVGLHFVGLWKATDLFVFVWTAIGMCVVSLIAIWLPGPSIGRAIDVRRAITGFGCMLVLWTTGVFGLR